MASSQLSAANDDKYVRQACAVTRYRSLCIRSLSPFSDAAKTSPSRWARAGVSVTITEAKSAVQYLIKLKRQENRARGARNSAALSDCIECFGNAIDELHKSLGILRNLNRRTFGTQMGDLNTWLSAALTDADTCLDGFEGQKGREVRRIRSRVSRASCVTSNSLALANKLASTGLRAIDMP
ncbi:21 kDa protein [Morus notabilis]|uniref:21 kDa protein n=2 Tax=Morus notabilis TaxID=981085 RepID=W9SIF3_9ROSA|nr:21 kDa protein [Morus notabilis]